ncbi:MAG TPA: shikimate dehydrogenase [Solirubrobacteraceae bacterium]|nr:shikimate dehydrogenase [Solirubrobacteraceae bacterium]
MSGSAETAPAGGEAAVGGADREARRGSRGPRLGVLGWPVAHSRSPAMQNAALRELGLGDWIYQRLPVPPELLEETTRALGAAGFVGANVTIPHKRAALAVASEASAAARAIGAANTLTFARGGGIAAENTDAPGLIAAMRRAGQDPHGRTALVLGAGGSARAAVWALREAGAAEVTVWNRTAARARELAAALEVRVVLLPEKADILINCTSVGLVPPASGSESALNLLSLTHDLVGRYSYVVDFVYGTNITELLAAARERGVPTLDGLELLVSQGALSLGAWTGQPIAEREDLLEIMRRAAGEAPVA